jgi:predicted nucleic acid-binding protein
LGRVRGVREEVPGGILDPQGTAAMVVNRDRVVIADTNIMSYAFKRLPIAKQYDRLLAGREVRIAFVTLAEMHEWAEAGGWGARRRLDLRLFLDRYQVIPCTPGIPELFARILVERKRAGEPMLADDAWIAATSLFHHLPLVTHDKNFLRLEGLRVISANPEIALLQAAESAGRTPLAMDMHCRCGV